MLSLPISVADVGIFCSRLSDATDGASVAGVAYQSDGHINVDEAFRTEAQAIYDVGFVASKSDLRNHAGTARFLKQNSGITVDGIAVQTNYETQCMLTSLLAMALADGTFTTSWKSADGSFTPLDAAGIISVATAVGTFIAKCFKTEATICVSINDGSMTNTDQIDAVIATI